MGLDSTQVATTDWATETTAGGTGVGAPPIGTTTVPPAGTGGFDQDWNVTAPTQTKDWADDDWGGAEPQNVVSACRILPSSILAVLLCFQTLNLAAIFVRMANASANTSAQGPPLLYPDQTVESRDQYAM